MVEHAANIEEIEPPGPTAGSQSRTLSFRERFFPEATCAEWNDWRWQLRNRITDLHELVRIMLLSEDERNVIVRHGKLGPVAITPYYASLLDPNDPSQPLCHPYVVDLVVTGLRQGRGVFISPFWREIAYGTLSKNNRG